MKKANIESRSNLDRERIKKLVELSKDRGYKIQGQKFNYLTALKKVKNSKSNEWFFRCDCGKKIAIRPGLVVRGKQRSCGCVSRAQKESEYKGVRYGNLVTVRRTGIFRYQGKHRKIQSKRAIWEFKCDCGKTVEKVLSFVKLQKNPSCGCLRKATEVGTQKLFFGQYKNGAKTRKLSFDLTFENFVKLIKQDCHYCRAEPKLSDAKAWTFQIKKNGIDRIDSDQGYRMNNCVPCCETCNFMKSDMSYNDFIAKVQKIANRSCGDDYKTRTQYATEANVGDTTKILLLCIYDMVEKFNMQKAEIKALFDVTVDEHIIETDENDKQVS